MMRSFLFVAGLFVLFLVFSGCQVSSPGAVPEDLDNLDSTWGANKNDTGNKLPDPEPSLLSVKMVSETEIYFEFSGPVDIVSLSFEPFLAIGSVENGRTVKVVLEEYPGPGILITADLTAEDAWGNTIELQVPFRSRNNRTPDMLINELRTEYSGLRSEFIEFKIKSSGNLGALRVFACGNYKNPLVYEFSPAEVTKDDYVVVHMRTLESLCVDEYGDDPAESGGTDSCTTAWDFWVPGSTKLLHKTDAVYVLDQDDKVVCAVMLSETPDTWWKKDYFAQAAGFLFNQNAWKSPAGDICTPMDAVSSANINTALTRTISRDETVENTNTCADWYITANSCATPGQKNNPKRY